ncbi:MAG: hypothetical protein NT178_12685 [Proteobacteria bacterium]|nr:hypothetical protein [Pseudomonadota bacterium]
MPQYTFKINDEYVTAEAFDLEDALRKAGIQKTDAYEVVGEDDFEDKCFLSAITDDILFGS